MEKGGAKRSPTWLQYRWPFRCASDLPESKEKLLPACSQACAGMLSLTTQQRGVCVRTWPTPTLTHPWCSHIRAIQRRNTKAYLKCRPGLRSTTQKGDAQCWTWCVYAQIPSSWPHATVTPIISLGDISGLCRVESWNKSRPVGTYLSCD